MFDPRAHTSFNLYLMCFAIFHMYFYFESGSTRGALENARLSLMSLMEGTCLVIPYLFCSNDNLDNQDYSKDAVWGESCPNLKT